MKSLLIIVVIGSTTLGCSTKPDAADIEYIKVFSLGPADSITRFNKGIGLGTYLYYEPKTDSIIYRAYAGNESNQYSTYSGSLQNSRYLDTLLRLVAALRKYGNGVTFDTTWTGDPYCGPELYVEYKDKKRVRFNDFILGYNDTLDQFCHFFYCLGRLRWHRKQVVDNRLVKTDSEAVAAMVKLKLYERRDMPYIPLSCDSTVDVSKVYGAWRQIAIYQEGNERNYSKLTLTKEGKWLTEKIRDGKTEPRSSGTFRLSKDGKIIIMKRDKKSYRHAILKLTETCFEFKSLDEQEYGYTIRYDRM